MRGIADLKYKTIINMVLTSLRNANLSKTRLTLLAISAIGFVLLMSSRSLLKGNFETSYPSKLQRDRKLPPVDYNDYTHGPSVREDFAALLKKRNYRTMIEVGVLTGDFANSILSNWPEFEHYYGVDLWRHQKNYVDFNNWNDDIHSKNYQTVLDSFTSRYGRERITLIRNYSTVGARLFAENSIDFVYIDARHDYCGVTEDLEAYYPIVKCGGLFAGHDFQWEAPGQDWSLCGDGSRVEGAVKRAVLDFTRSHGIKRMNATREMSWFLFKEC